MQCFKVVAACLLAYGTVVSIAEANHENIEIVVFIEKSDPFSGVKVRHKVLWLQNKQEYHTGTTDIPFAGRRIKVKSKGDDFSFRHDEKGVHVKGETASGITAGAGPYINYNFTFRGDSDRTTVKGCHDGYPSYKIYENGKLIYYHKHKPTNLWKLFGKCDIQVNQAYTYPVLH